MRAPLGKVGKDQVTPRQALPRRRGDAFASAIDSGGRVPGLQARHWRPPLLSTPVRGHSTHLRKRSGIPRIQGPGPPAARATAFRGFGQINGDRRIRPGERHLIPAHRRKRASPYRNQTLWLNGLGQSRVVIHIARMAKRCDALIVGGGLNGCTMALALARAGLSATVIERTPRDDSLKPDFDGRGYALALASKRMLEALGIWNRVADRAQSILRIVVTDGRAGDGPSPLLLEFDHAELDEGPVGFMLEDRYLRRALSEALAECPNVTRVHGRNVIAHEVTDSDVCAEFDNGGTARGTVLVAADGQNSAIAHREGITYAGWPYGQTSLVCAIGHERPHNGTAHQFFMPGGPLALLPLPGNRTSIVWTESSKTAERIRMMDADGYIDALGPAVGGFLGEIRLEGDRYSYPLALSVANRFAKRRVALIGDAAHRVHPLAGQGLNAGLKDVGTLVEVLVRAHRRGEDIGALDVIERYQRWRRFDTATLAAATDSINRLFSNDDGLVRSLRDIGMGVVNAVPTLRRGLMREAAGLTGDLPKLLQGRPI